MILPLDNYLWNQHHLKQCYPHVMPLKEVPSHSPLLEQNGHQAISRTGERLQRAIPEDSFPHKNLHIPGFSSSTGQRSQGFSANYFINASLEMLIELVILAVLLMPSIMAASSEETGSALIKAKGEEDLEQTFENEQDEDQLLDTYRSSRSSQEMRDNLLSSENEWQVEENFKDYEELEDRRSCPGH